MIELHMFPAAWGLPTFTPFGLKLAAHMTLAKLPFNFVYEGNPARGPRKKLPWIKDGEHVVSDSARAVEHLTAHYDDRLDG